MPGIVETDFWSAADQLIEAGMDVKRIERDGKIVWRFSRYDLADYYSAFSRIPGVKRSNPILSSIRANFPREHYKY